MGSFDADYEKNTLSAEMTRTVLASAAKVELESSIVSALPFRFIPIIVYVKVAQVYAGGKV